MNDTNSPTCNDISQVKTPVIEFGTSDDRSYLSTSIDSTGKLTINSPFYNHRHPYFPPKILRITPDSVKALVASAESLGFFSMTSESSEYVKYGNEISKYYTVNPQKFITINLPCSQHRVAVNKGRESRQFNQIYALLSELKRIEPKIEGQEPDRPLGATGGPFIKEESVKAIALREAKVHGLLRARVRDLVLTTHGGLVGSKLFNPHTRIPVTDLREVYLVTLLGEVMVSRTPGGPRFPQTDVLNMELDATTGQFLNVANW